MTARRPLLLLLLAAALFPAPARADKMTKEDKAWLDSVTPLMLQDEMKTFKDLKDKADRAEFEKIFWARRDPDLETPENESQPDYQKAVAAADSRFKVRGRAGSLTDCGRLFILLGEPAEVKKEKAEQDEEAPPGARLPETWTYKGKNQGVVNFDADCMGPQGKDFQSQLDRIAEQRIVHPNIDYRKGSDGHIVKLADQLPKPSPARSLIKAPRQDFPVATQAGFLKVEGGGTALLGVVHGDAKALGAAKPLELVVTASAYGENDKEAASVEQPEAADVQADGSFSAGFRMVLTPGKYRLRAGALDPKSGKGSITETSVDVPDLNTGDLALTVFALRDVQEVAEGAVDPQNPFAAYTLGKTRLIPHFGSTFSKADSISIFFQYYDAKTDPATSKASAVASVAILKGTKPVARAQDQPFDTVVGGNIVGPIAFTDYAPGSYTVQVKMHDNVAGKEVAREWPFEVK